MAWIALLIAGLLEVAWAIGLKHTAGFTRPGWTAFTVASALASFWFLAIALRTLPIGTAYAIWTGIGAVGTVLLGIALFDEPAAPLRLACVALILAGIVGLRLVTPS